MTSCEEHTWTPDTGSFFCTHCGARTAAEACESCGGDELIQYEHSYVCSECKCPMRRGKTSEMIMFDHLKNQLDKNKADPFCEMTQYVKEVLDRIDLHQRRVQWVRETPQRDALKAHIERIKSKRN